MTPTRAGRGVALSLVALTWLGGVVAGFFSLSTFDATPGAQGTAPAHWPAASALPAPSGRYTLVLAVHPLCPCSRASLQELGEIVERCRDRLAVHVLCYRPAHAGAAWTDNALVRQARAILGVSVYADREGVEARRFGAATSGHAVLYGRRGELLFSGGLTRGRAQVGDSRGRAAVLARVTGAACEPDETEVFGCPLCGPAAPRAAEGTK